MTATSTSHTTRRVPRLAALAGAVALTLTFSAGAAGAAEETLGTAAASTSVSCSASGSVASGPEVSATAAGSREVAQWATGTTSGAGETHTLDLWRPAGPGYYTLVWRSAPQTMTNAGVQTFPVTDSPLVESGDRFGLGIYGYGRDCAERTGSAADTLTYLGNVAVGGTYNFGGQYQGYRANLAVTLAPADATAPVITGTVDPAAPDGSNGWYRNPAKVSFTVTDDESPVTGTSGCDPVAVPETAGTTYECSATSSGGTSTQSVTVKRDATAPTATFDTGPTDGAEYVWGTAPAAGTCTASDALSGPKDCVVTGYSDAVGSHTVTASATDQAGNSATTTRTYTVAPWTTGGFSAPVNGGGVLNTVKAGSTVPVKFEVFAGQVEVTDPAKVSMSATARSCNATAEDAVEITTTGETSLRYDTVSGQFVYNWKTPKAAGTCYTLTMTSADGTTSRALFALR